MKKRVLALLLAGVMLVSTMAACGGGSDSDTSSTTSIVVPTVPSASSAAESDTESEVETEPTGTSEFAQQTGLVYGGAPADTSEHYDFDYYYNFSSWTHTWGDDEFSAYMAEKFNITVNMFAGENDPDGKLNIMMASNDMPDVIYMNAGQLHDKIARQGYFVDLSTLMYDGCYYEEAVAPGTANMVKVDGVLYDFMNWTRKGATGGNYQWLVNSAIYEELGSPSLDTFEDLHDYLLAVKEQGITSYNGQSVSPFYTGTDNGYYVWLPIFRALGMESMTNTYWVSEDGQISHMINNETAIEGLSIANDWFSEGLFDATVFTDSTEQLVEKLSNGRAALAFYDFSQDNSNNFRRLTLESSGGECDWDVLGYHIKTNGFMFPAVEGVDVVYGDATGGNGTPTCITTAAEQPQRIFDWLDWIASPEGSLMMQYGPVGGTMLESIDYSGDMPAPVLKKDVSEFTSEETDAAGAWFWTTYCNADYVDEIKYGLNRQLPEEGRDYTVSVQDELCTYNAENPTIGQKFFTNQYVNLQASIDSQTETGIALTAIQDECKAKIPQIIMASSKDEFNALVADLQAYVAEHAGAEIDEIMQNQYEANIAAQGYDAFSDEYDVYKLNK